MDLRVLRTGVGLWAAAIDGAEAYTLPPWIGTKGKPHRFIGIWAVVVENLGRAKARATTTELVPLRA
jgi:hypothetical protein